MLTLLALFTGKPGRIPKNILEKPLEKRSEDDKKKIDNLLNSIIKRRNNGLYKRR